MRLRIFQSIPELLTYMLLILMLSLNIVELSISSSNARQARLIAAQNQTFAVNTQKQTIVARQQNLDRQNQLKAYIECIVLIGKTNPTFDFVNASLQDTKAVLDQCAASTDG